MVVALLAAACGSDDDLGAADEVAAAVSAVSFGPSACGGAFVAHDLPHTTTPTSQVVAMVDGTGTGVLAEDLDGDGLVDLVLPNLTGGATLLWNRGGLAFEATALADVGRFRQAITFDIDDDGDRDLMLSTGVGPPQPFYADSPTGPYDRAEIRELGLITFSLSPGDLEGDGDVDLVASSYAVELTVNRDLRALSGIDIGTAVYRPPDTGFEEELLSDSAQALVSQIVDIDGDGRSDVVVGNDLGTPDRFWLGSDFGLTLTQLFDTTTLSTMSMDVGDVDNDGDRDLIATDMKPMPGAPVGPWEELADDIEAARVDDVQVPENVVQLRADDGYEQVAATLGVDATGWSWSGLLGDLDHDGLQDLYVVNGMQAEGMFDSLPESELVEANQAFRNLGDDFAGAPEWELASERGGRGMAMADFDDDGDLDIVVNNLGAPTQLFENQLCGGASLVIEPRWSGAQNLDALGATVVVDSGELSQQRIITATRGYLSGSPTQAHVGLPSGEPVQVSITWPDGLTTRLDDVEPGHRIVVDRSEPVRSEP